MVGVIQGLRPEVLLLLGKTNMVADALRGRLSRP